MGAKWQRAKIQIPDFYGPTEREAIAREVLDHIRNRTQKKNVDKNGKPFPKYSKEYVESLNFKIAGKNNRVDLTLSGDMLGAMDLLNHKSGEIMIGFENGSPENAKADGNIRGTYGQKSPTGKARDFLGIEKSALREILNKYPKDKAKQRAEMVLNATNSKTNKPQNPLGITDEE
jgi:hypothetical protein